MRSVGIEFIPLTEKLWNIVDKLWNISLCFVGVSKIIAGSMILILAHHFIK